MIKIIALITMIIDHVGVIFFPDIVLFRIIGRLSMPLFAYSIANGFYYSKQKGSLFKYIRNLSIFAVLSQFPYGLLFSGTNIGLTWLISVLVLIVIETPKKKIYSFLSIMGVIGALIIIKWFLDIDYGIYGMITPLILYEFMIKHKNIVKGSLIFLLITGLYILIEHGMIIQLYSCLALFIIYIIQKYDDKVRLPKSIYYVFYPAHLMLLFIIKELTI